MRNIIMAIFLSLTAGAASAASMWVSGDTLNIKGATTAGDYQKVLQIWGDDIKNIELSGPGGSADDAKKIANFLKPKNITTAVKANTTCASACAMIWLSGSERIAEEGAKIGLHFAYLEAKHMENVALEYGWNGVREVLNKMAVWSTQFYNSMDILDKEKLFEKMSYNTELWTLSQDDIEQVIGATYVK